jgi:hypothetical protein
VIEFKWPRYYDQVPGNETWSLCLQHDVPTWNCFRGPRFSVSLMTCDGKPEELYEELQALREACPKKPHTEGFTVCWQDRRLMDQEPVIRRRADGTIRFGLLWVVTSGYRVLAEEYEERDGPALLSFVAAVKEWVDANADFPLEVERNAHEAQARQ